MHNHYLLSDVADYADDRVNIRSVSLDDYVTTDNMLPNKKGVGKAVNLPPQTGNMPAYESGDILIGNIRPYLKKIWHANRKGGCSADVLNIRVKEHHDSRFVYYSLFRDDFFKHMMRGSKGTKMPRGDKTQIMRFTLPRFDKPVQQEIAAILSSLDSKIDLNNRISVELEAMAKTLYDYWFVQFDFPDENGKPYKSSGGKMEYNPTLKRHIPAGWGVMKLSDVLQNVSVSVQADKVTDTEPYTPIDSLPMKKMSFGNYEPSSEAKTSLIRYKQNDILIGAMRIYFHRVCIAPFDGITRTTTMVLRAKNEENLPYFYQVCNEERLIAYGTKISGGTQQPYVNWDNALSEYFFVYPQDGSLISQYSNKIRPIIKSVILREYENKQLAQLRDWLLPMLMNGQVKIKDSEQAQKSSSAA